MDFCNGFLILLWIYIVVFFLLISFVLIFLCIAQYIIFHPFEGSTTALSSLVLLLLLLLLLILFSHVLYSADESKNYYSGLFHLLGNWMDKNLDKHIQNTCNEIMDRYEISIEAKIWSKTTIDICQFLVHIFTTHHYFQPFLSFSDYTNSPT